MVLKACERPSSTLPEAEPPKKKSKKEREEAAVLLQEAEHENKDDPAAVEAKNVWMNDESCFKFKR